MLQEAKDDPPEPGNLFVMVVREEDQATSDSHPQEQTKYIKVNQREEGEEEETNAPENFNNLVSRSPEPIAQNIPHYPGRNEETYPSYLMLATMLKYLNNGNAFAENCLED